jgi:peptidyl-prolyl cis-trans isomerase C
MKKLNRILREPLVHFLLIGGLLFVITSWIGKEKQGSSRQIVIDDAIAGKLALQYRSQMGTLPSRSTLDGMIADYIRDEIYYREALKTGLDKDDEIIRRRLSQKYAFLQNDITADKVPTNEELQQFYASHTQLFRDSATVSFTHIYFSSDNSSSQTARQRALDVLKKLSVAPSISSSQLGDPFPLQSHYSDITRLDAKETFGTTPFVDSLFGVPVGRWTEPVRSGYGWHLLYIHNRTSATLLPFNSVKNAALQAWKEQQRSQANAANYTRLASHYKIVRKYLEEK